MTEEPIKVLQISNISPSATKDQLQTLFAYIGRIDDCKIYPSTGSQTQPKFGYIKFDRESSVELGQHLTNVVFIDRALICIPALSNKIPDEEAALRAGPAVAGQRQLPPNVKNVNKPDADGQEMIYTEDPTISELGLTPYPPLPAGTELSKVEEIRRTVYIGNLEKGCNCEELLTFLNDNIGEVMYMRKAAGSDHLPCDYVYVEFSNQESVPVALQNNSIEFNGRPLKIQHSRVAIIKPKQKTTDQSLEEIEEAIRINEARGEGAYGRGYSPADRGVPLLRRRSRSPIRRRSPSPRRRTPSPIRRSRSRSSRRRSPSPRRRSRSRSRSSRRRSPSPRRRSRSRSPSRHKKKHKKSEKSKDKDRRKRSKSRERKRRRSRS